MNVDQLIAELLKQDSQAEVYVFTAPHFDSEYPSIGRYLLKSKVVEIGVQEGNTDLCILGQFAQGYLQEWKDDEGA